MECRKKNWMQFNVILCHCHSFMGCIAPEMNPKCEFGTISEFEQKSKISSIDPLTDSYPKCLNKHLISAKNIKKYFIRYKVNYTIFHFCSKILLFFHVRKPIISPGMTWLIRASIKEIRVSKTFMWFMLGGHSNDIELLPWLLRFILCVIKALTFHRVYNSIQYFTHNLNGY